MKTGAIEAAHHRSVDDQIAATALQAGLGRARPVSLSSVDARRTQLWAVVFVVLLALGVAMALLSVGTDRSVSSFIVSLPGFRVGIVLVLAGFGGYVFEKERKLRRLSGLLIAQERSAAQQAARLAQLTEVDRLKSEFVSSVELELAAALRGVRDTAACLDPADDVQRRILGMLAREIDHAERALRQQVADHDRVVLEQARPHPREVTRAGPRS